MPGCKDAVKEGITGLIIKSRDSKGLADAIEKLIKNRELLNSMSLEGRRNAENFLISIKLLIHINTYQFLLNQK